jgi:aryl-alcohol dehydrogenase-like predicted oxidoreductase
MTRRDAIKTGIAGAGLMIGSSFGLDNQSEKLQASDVVQLGQTDVKLSRLAIGTGVKAGRGSSPLLQKGEQNFVSLMKHYMDQGGHFFDMADWYGSHEFTKKALAGIPRDEYVLSTKIWNHKYDGFEPSGGAFKEVDRFRQELGSDYIDMVLIHFLRREDWIDHYKRVRDELSELKEKGVVRAVGVSCHSHVALKKAVTDPWTDFVLARYNYKGGSDFLMDDAVEEITKTLTTAKENGKGVVAMKVFGEGRLIEPEQKDTSLKFVLRSGLVDAITIGMQNEWEIKDTVERMAKV